MNRVEATTTTTTTMTTATWRINQTAVSDNAAGCHRLFH
jgi:hypothetical protein